MTSPAARDPPPPIRRVSARAQPARSVIRYIDNFDNFGSSEMGTASINSVRFRYLPNSTELVTEKM